MSVSQFINLSIDPNQSNNNDEVDENAGLIDQSDDDDDDYSYSSQHDASINQTRQSNKLYLCMCWLFGMLCAIGIMSFIIVNPAFLPSRLQHLIIQTTNQSTDYTFNQTDYQHPVTRSDNVSTPVSSVEPIVSIADQPVPQLPLEQIAPQCNPLDDRDPRYHPTANSYHNCTSLVDWLIDQHFHEQKSRHPNLLTYRPVVDCSKGRYLLLNEKPGGFFNDGTGMAMLHRNAVLQFAQMTNLTIVHLPWKSEHLEFESNDEREAFWPVRDWEVSRAQYDQCVEQSNVKKHVLKIQLGIMPFVRPLVNDHSIEQWAIRESLLQSINQFVTERDANIADGGGFTIYSEQTQIAQGSMLYTNIIWETRWWLKNRLIETMSNQLIPLKLPFPSLTPIARERRMQMAKLTQDAHVNERLPIELIDYDSAFESCPEISPERALKIAVHIRRGDVMAVLEDPPGEQMLRASHAERFIAHSAFVSILTKAYSSLSDHAKSRWFVTVFSEGYITDFADIFSALIGMMPNGHCHVSFVLNGRTIDTARRIVGSDVIVTSHSAFSTMMSLFNSVAIKLDLNQDFQRAHGQANHMQMTIQQKRDTPAKSLPIAHTTGSGTELGYPLSEIKDKAKMTDAQAKEFSKRVDELLALNDRNLQSNEPLFLDYTYRSNRPKEWYYV